MGGREIGIIMKQPYSPYSEMSVELIRFILATREHGWGWEVVQGAEGCVQGLLFVTPAGVRTISALWTQPMQLYTLPASIMDQNENPRKCLAGQIHV